jgi:PAS domain S-box-containing protein
MQENRKVSRLLHADQCLPPVLGLRFASGITLIYLFLASLWIYFSDQLMMLIARSPDQLLLLSTGKGWLFVSTTGLLLFWLLYCCTKHISENQRLVRACAERHRMTMQAIGEGVLSTDANGRVEIMNPVAEFLTGWSVASASGQPLEAVFRIDGADEGMSLQAQLAQVIGTGSVIGPDCHASLVARDGTTRPISCSAAPIQDSDGNVSGLVLVFRDQSAEQAADAVLCENDRELKRAQRLAHIGSWIFNLGDGLVSASDEARRIYGITGDTVTIADVQKMPLVTYREMLDKALSDLINKNKPYDVEFKIRRPIDGTVRYIHSIAEFDRSRNRVIGTIHDITDRKQAEAARQESEYRYIELFEHAVDGILVGSPEGIITDANSSAIRLLGVDKAHICGQHIRSLFEESQLQEVPLEFAKLAQGQTVVRERQYCRPDGEVLYIEMHSKQMPDGGYHSIIRDITGRKRDEQERERLQAQLMQSRKLESVGRLAGGVAHDFNNMLGVIMGYAEMAMSKIGPQDSLRGDLQEILDAARRSADITSQLLAFARKQPIMPHVLDLNTAVGGVLNMLRRLIGEHIDLVWSPVPEAWPVRMDRSQVDQILTNLCINARDAISGTGRIVIETDCVMLTQVDCAGQPGLAPGCYMKLVVTDNGCGMDSALLDAVFEPFFTTKDTGKGTGLGLATVYGIVKQNGGYIHVSSKPREGTRFEILIPRCDGALDTDAPEPPESPSAPGAGEMILVAEDEPGILKISNAGLSRLGYQVKTATSPKAALELAKANAGRIQLLVTDVVMPGMNGKDLATAVSAHCPGIKVLYMSGYTASVIENHGVLEPGMHFIQKPFTIRALAAKVRESLDGYATMA